MFLVKMCAKNKEDWNLKEYLSFSLEALACESYAYSNLGFLFINLHKSFNFYAKIKKKVK